MSGIIILILIIVVSLLFLRLCLMKQQLRKILKQMKEPGENYISVDFVDSDLESIVRQINKMIDLMQNVKIESIRGEKSIKSSISMISHDMRTPLTSVIGYLQLAEKNCKEEETLQDIRVALDRAKYCNKLVNDFFELSVVDSDRYTPVMEKVNICEVVCDEILANYLSFEKNGIALVFEQANNTVWVSADRKLLVRVIQNLISNAIKYSTGKVNFVVSKEKKASLYISSSISKSIDVEKIFDKYYREENSRSSEGIGLGLYICRKLIKDMNGDISAYCNDNMLNIKIELDLC